MSREWSDKFNALPKEIRLIGAMCQTEMRIQQLGMEKARLVIRHSQSMKEINAHIKNLEDWLKNEGRGVEPCEI